MMAELVSALVKEELSFEYDALPNHINIIIGDDVFTIKVEMGEFWMTGETWEFWNGNAWKYKMVGRSCFDVVDFIRGVQLNYCVKCEDSILFP